MGNYSNCMLNALPDIHYYCVSCQYITSLHCAGKAILASPDICIMQDNFTNLAGFCFVLQENFDPLHSNVPRGVWREIRLNEVNSEAILDNKSLV